MKITAISLWAYKLFRPEEPLPFGGAELQMALLSQALAARPGVTVQFITRGHGEREEFEYKNIRVLKLPYRESRSGRMLLGTMDLVRACLDWDTDVFWQRAGGIETGLVALAARRKQKPFVFMTSHLWDVDGTRQKRLGPGFGRVYRYGLTHADTVITQTEEQQSALLTQYRLPSQVLRSAHRIPRTIDRTKAGVLWVGRCEPWKRPDLVPELAKALPNVSFSMVCPPANSLSYFEEIERQARNQPNLAFYPGLPFEEVETLFDRHRLYLCTSEHEGFPNTFVQAAKWGTPILSLHLDPDRLLETHRFGLCLRGDFGHLREAVSRLSVEEEEWRTMQTAGRDYARTHHDVERIAEALLLRLREAQIHKTP